MVVQTAAVRIPCDVFSRNYRVGFINPGEVKESVRVGEKVELGDDGVLLWASELLVPETVEHRVMAIAGAWIVDDVDVGLWEDELAEVVPDALEFGVARAFEGPDETYINQR
jgi:hypothetical protein